MRRYQRILMKIGEAMPQSLQMRFYRWAGMKIGNQVIIKTGFYTDRPERVTIGDNSFLNNFCHFFFGNNSDADIKVGNNVYFAPNVSLLTATHAIGNETQRAGITIHKSVVIEDGVWIGAGATILPGVKIARGGVIGAGSVVTKSTEPNALYYGVPAKKIRELDNKLKQ